MKNSTGSWLLHPRAATGAIRSAMLVGTVAFALIAQSFISDGSMRWTPYLFLIIVLYGGVSLGIMHAHLRSRGRPRSIIMRDGILAIPRIFFPCHLVSVTQIKSIEKYASSSEIIAVLIGRINSSSILIERRNFASKAEFERFLEFMDQLEHEINSRTTKGALQAEGVRRWGQGSRVIAVLALTLLVTYLISSRPGIEQLNNDAMLLGGLIKGSLGPGIYRIASSFFLHSTPFHLGFNILALAIIGQSIKVIFGDVRLINILFASAILGSLLSLAFSPYETVIGASGGILGLVGAYSVVCVRHQQQIPGSVSVSHRGILIMLGLQILFDLITDGTDIFSHLGGLLFGLLYAYYILRRHTPANAATFSPVEFFVAIGLVLAYAAGLIYYFSLYARLF
ncbi:MAG: peptidase rhomboid family [Massilia sp.]|nr:peptidase rhomboid family [Massilia sp.]